MKKTLRYLFLLLLAVVWGGEVFAADVAYKTLTFSKDVASGVSSYSKSWDATTDNFTWTIKNFNNNNWGTNWETIIKCGNKNAASIGSIENKTPFEEAVTKVEVTVDKITASSVNSIYLTVASDASFSKVVETVTSQSIAAGILSFSITTPSASNYLKLAFDCKKSDNKIGNGFVTVSKVVYYTKETEKKPTLAFSASEVTVYKGQTASFVAPTLTWKDKDGNVVSAENYVTTYKSSEEKVAKVDDSGNVTFVGLGETTITATALHEDNTELSASYKLTYAKDPNAKDKLVFDVANQTVYANATASFVAPKAKQYNVEGNEVTPDLIMYSAEPTGIVEVNENTGDITKWLKAGTVTISAASSYEDEDYDASYTLTYKLLPTTLTFSQATVNGELGTTPATPSFTLKSGDTDVDGTGNILFDSSDKAVATVDDNGELTLLAAGTTTITAQYVGSDVYEESNVASYTLTVIDPNAPLSSIVFDYADGAFGKFGSYTDSEKTVNFTGSDNNTYEFTYVQCMDATGGNSGKIQMKASKGELTSPVFATLPNGYKVVVYYNTSSNSTPLTISSDAASTTSQSTKVSGNNYRSEIVLPGASSFTVNAGGNATYVSKIEIIPFSAPIILAEGEDNTTLVSKNVNKTLNVSLTRTLKANIWNTFCVPFDITLAGSALEGATVSKVKSVDEATSTIYFEAETDKIEAGKAYLVKPETAIENPTFNAVTIQNVTPANTTGNDNYQFVGTYSPKTISEAEYGTIFGVNDANKLAKIKANTTMNGIRAYFVIPADAAAKLNFDGEATGISTIEGDNAAATGRVYNLQGQYVGTSLDGLAKGIYVVNGKKVAK